MSTLWMRKGSPSSSRGLAFFMPPPVSKRQLVSSDTEMESPKRLFASKYWMITCSQMIEIELDDDVVKSVLRQFLDDVLQQGFPCHSDQSLRLRVCNRFQPSPEPGSEYHCFHFFSAFVFSFPLPASFLGERRASYRGESLSNSTAA